MSQLFIVGLGPGSPDYLTRSASAVLEAAGTILVDDIMHPVSRWLSSHRAVIGVDARTVAAAIASGLQSTSPIVVGLSGNPTRANSVVKAIFQAAQGYQGDIRIVPGVGFFDAARAALPSLARAESIQILPIDPDERDRGADPSPFQGVYRQFDPTHAVFIELSSRDETNLARVQRILETYPADHSVTAISFDEAPDPQLRSTTVSSLNQDWTTGNFRALFVEPMDPLADRSAFDTLRYIVARLRAPNGCPWDREQNYGSIKKHLIEETYEAIAAIDDADYPKFAEELGDVVLQVMMYSQLAREAGDFTLEDVLRSVNDKLVRRHPHVFGDVDVKDSAEVLKNWEKIKLTEQVEKPSTFGGVPEAAPALMRAEAIQSRAERYGWERPAVFRSAETVQATGTDRTARIVALGDVLFDLVSLARQDHLDPEEALRLATNRFKRHFDRILAEQSSRGEPFDALPPGERRRLLNETSPESTTDRFS